ncbi:LPS biosynthesis protein [Methylophaga nitratireducenticrescens]|nr:LPS biosynthesis protein [Methylophaga nitratireducenticrescens]
MKFCKRCLYSTTHPLGLVLDEEGICSGCRIHEEKDRLDWQDRWAKLEDVVRPYRNSNGGNYDCIVPVTGSHDSYYILYLVKECLGLNPLLVTYNKYFNTPLGIRNLANLRIRFNCDILYQNVNPISVKKITRNTLKTFGSVYWPILAGQSVYPVQTAVRFNIPLIIWGAHQGLEQVGMFSHEHEVEMTRRYRKDHDLMGHEADDLISIFNTLSEEDIWQYRYPSDHELNATGVRGIYLGNYVRWDPKKQHEQMIEEYDYQTAEFPRTFDCYDFVDCFNYMDLHDILKLYKHGYSRVTDHATREIRFGRLTREQGLQLVRKYEHAPMKYMELFCGWLGVTENSLNFMMDLHRDKRFWSKAGPNEWIFHGWSAMQLNDRNDNNIPLNNDINFKVTNQLEYQDSATYITFGKGWP